MRGLLVALVLASSATALADDVNEPDGSGWTPLMTAAEMGKVDDMKSLLAKGANIELGNPSVYGGATPLLIAMEFGAHDAAVLLLDRHASIAGDRGVGVLERAAMYGFDDIVDRMLKAKVSPKGNSALELAAKYGKVSVLKKLIKAGANVGAVNKYDHDYSAFMVACQERQVEAAKVLLDAGADVNAVDADGTTALHWAVFGERPDEMHIYPADDGPHDTIYSPHETAPLVELLVAHKVKLNVADKDGNTALHEAAMIDAASAAQVLVKAGADTKAKNKDGFTAFDLARERNNSVMPVLGPAGTPTPPPRPPIIHHKKH
ncbi:MAG TPA: ankyrin repeat domain-containing protein [Kofleriaceae bacterium]|jgi:ankyrin repeat protein